MATETLERPKNQIVIAPYGVDKDGNPHKPNPTQQLTLDWVDKHRREQVNLAGLDLSQKGKGIPILYLQGGVGSGKTRAILAPVIELLCEISNLRMLWGRQDFNDLRVSAMETFFEVVPPEMIASRSVQEHRYKIGQPGGGVSQLFFKDLKDLSGLGSQEFGVIVITEVHELIENAFRVLKMRCRQANVPLMILMEGNPPNEGHWLDRLTDPQSDDYDPDIEMHKVSTYENWDNLPDSYKSSLQTMPSSWRKKFLTGEFGFMPDGRPYYTGYIEPVHKRKCKFNPALPLDCGWDFGKHHPAFVVTQIEGVYWKILRELMGSNITIKKFAELQVIPMLNEYFPNANIRHWGDPACHQVNDKSEQTSHQILQQKNIHVGTKVSTYRLRKEIIEGKINMLEKGLPLIMVDPLCKTVNDGFMGGYHFPKRKESQQATDKFDVPFRDGFYEHPMNAVEYIAINRFSPLERRQSNQPKRKSKSMDNM